MGALTRRLRWCTLKAGENEWSVRVGVGWYAALEEADRYLKSAMKNPTPLSHRAASLMFTMENKYEQAFAEAERAIALDPNDPSGHEAMALILLFTGKPEKASNSSMLRSASIPGPISC